MKTLSGIAIFILLLTLISCNQSGKKSGETVTEWEYLFDGTSVDKWKTFNGGEVTGWKIVDGELHNSGVGSDHGGDIVTKNQYENFELSLEWKIDKASNSGIFIHVQEGVTDAIYESGPEYQLLDDEGWPEKLEPYQYSGANYAMHVPENVKLKPQGEWNETRIVVKNPHVEHWLNGKKVVEYDLWSDEWKALKAAGKWAGSPHYGEASKGNIGLQDHGGLTMFRNIKIREFK